LLPPELVPLPPLPLLPPELDPFPPLPLPPDPIEPPLLELPPEPGPAGDDEEHPPKIICCAASAITMAVDRNFGDRSFIEKSPCTGDSCGSRIVSQAKLARRQEP